MVSAHYQFPNQTKQSPKLPKSQNPIFQRVGVHPTFVAKCRVQNSLNTKFGGDGVVTDLTFVVQFRTTYIPDSHLFGDVGGGRERVYSAQAGTRTSHGPSVKLICSVSFAIVSTVATSKAVKISVLFEIQIQDSYFLTFGIFRHFPRKFLGFSKKKKKIHVKFLFHFKVAHTDLIPNSEWFSIGYWA